MVKWTNKCLTKHKKDLLYNYVLQNNQEPKRLHDEILFFKEKYTELKIYTKHINQIKRTARACLLPVSMNFFSLSFFQGKLLRLGKATF